jgi:hypothetical protein
MTPQKMLHLLRNPHGHSEEELREARLRAADMVERVVQITNAQAEDAGLWFNARYITEAYLQQELRRLHAAVETVKPNCPPPRGMFPE